MIRSAFLMHMLLLSVWCAAQNSQPGKKQAESDFYKVSNRYAKMERYSMNLNYQLYSDTSAQSVYEAEGLLMVNGGNRYEKVGEIESFHSGGYSVVINHNLKTLLYAKAKAQKKETLSPADISNLINDCETLTVTQSGKARIYTLSGLKGSYDVIEISINTKGFTINSCRLRSSAQASSLLISYSEPGRKNIPESSWFLWSRFLVKDGARLKSKEPYQHYEIFNQVDQPQTN